MLFLKFILRTAVGFVAGSLVLGLYCGNFAEGFLLLAMAVICTAGLGLIVIIPASYLLGLLMTIWWIPFGNRTRQASSPPPLPASAYGRAIENYVRDARRAGSSEDFIREQCRRNGASEADIQRVLASAAS